MKCLSYLLLSLMLATVVGATERTWTGNVDDDWFVAGNWDPSDYPKADDIAVINSGTVVLTNATEALLSLTVGDGATLVFSNWTTQVEANTVVLEEGSLVTLPDPFTEAGMSNRVRFVVTNFTLEEGATIDVEGRGFDREHGQGSAGRSGGNEAPGASYGGRGGANSTDSLPAAPYGSLTAPDEPGSGGGNGAGGTTTGRPGGGLVQILASGTVTLDGTINADGGSSGDGANQRGGSGSGGGIFIQSHTFGGSASGLVSANGGSAENSNGTRSAAGAGGGGRIAVIYEALAGSPAVRFQANPGPLGAFDVDRASPDPVRHMQAPQPGTLYFPDLTLPNSVMSAHGSSEGLQGNLHWGSGGTWTLSGLTVAEGVFAISPSNAVAITGDLVIGSNGVFRVGGASLDLDVTGNLTIENSGRLQVYAGETNGVPNYGARVKVGGTFTVQSNAWVYPFSHSLNGGSVKFELNHLTVAEGGGFDARGRGYRGGAVASGHGPGGGIYASNRGGGGGYGGKGGNASSTGAFGGSTYGNPHVPLLPGSGGGGRSGAAWPGGGGGGLIWIEATGEVLLNGSLLADGREPDVSSRAGGGSGGGVFVAADSMSGGSSALLSADGADWSGSDGGGGAGGGRIALWNGVPQGVRNDYLSGNTNAVLQEVTASFYDGSVSVSYGTGHVNPPDPDGAQDGTAFFYSLAPISGTFFIFR